jgi:adenosine/AMP kinase
LEPAHKIRLVDDLNTKVVKLQVPENTNLVLGTSHFIKTVEDLYEVLVGGVPGIKFGLAFCEASGPCLIRHAGNDPELEDVAIKNALQVSAGHSFLVVMKNAFPVNVLNAIKAVPEICTVHCATANPVEVILAETEQGNGILGVVDGCRSKGIEKDNDVRERKDFLRKIGYKL